MEVADLEAEWHCTVSAFLGEYLGAAVDQGPRGTCMAQATTAAHEQRLEGCTRLSAEYLYWLGRKSDPDAPSDGGVASSHLMQGLGTTGQPELEIWPYDPGLDDESEAYAPPTGEYQLYRRASQRCPITADQVRSAIERGTPPVAVISVTQDFCDRHGGVVAEVDGETPSIGLHAVLVIGIASNMDGEESFIVRNSWGSDWGWQGHALVPVLYLTDRLVELWVLTGEPAT